MRHRLLCQILYEIVSQTFLAGHHIKWNWVCLLHSFYWILFSIAFHHLLFEGFPADCKTRTTIYTGQPGRSRNPWPSDGSGSSLAYSNKRSTEVNWFSVSDNCRIPHWNNPSIYCAVLSTSPTEPAENPNSSENLWLFESGINAKDKTVTYVAMITSNR